MNKWLLVFLYTNMDGYSISQGKKGGAQCVSRTTLGPRPHSLDVSDSYSQRQDMHSRRDTRQSSWGTYLDSTMGSG